MSRSFSAAVDWLTAETRYNEDASRGRQFIGIGGNGPCWVESRLEALAQLVRRNRLRLPALLNCTTDAPAPVP